MAFQEIEKPFFIFYISPLLVFSPTKWTIILLVKIPIKAKTNSATVASKLILQQFFLINRRRNIH